MATSVVGNLLITCPGEKVARAHVINFRGVMPPPRHHRARSSSTLPSHNETSLDRPAPTIEEVRAAAATLPEAALKLEPKEDPNASLVARAPIDSESDDDFSQSNVAGARSISSVSKKFLSVEAETLRSPHYAALEMGADITSIEVMYYRLENMIGADPNTRFIILFSIGALLCFIMATIWFQLRGASSDDLSENWWGSVFMTFQIFVSGGADTSIIQVDERFLFLAMLLCGVTLISILVGERTTSLRVLTCVSVRISLRDF